MQDAPTNNVMVGFNLEEEMIRRKLFGFLATAPFACAAIVSAKANEDNAPESELMRLKHGPQWDRMSLMAGPANEKYRSVGLAVGKDGFLWVKVGEDWRRISVD